MRLGKNIAIKIPINLKFVQALSKITYNIFEDLIS